MVEFLRPIFKSEWEQYKIDVQGWQWRNDKSQTWTPVQMSIDKQFMQSQCLCSTVRESEHALMKGLAPTLVPPREQEA